MQAKSSERSRSRQIARAQPWHALSGWNCVARLWQEWPVLARSGMAADAWTTALRVAGPGEGLALAQRLGLEALWLLRRDGALVEVVLGRFGAAAAPQAAA